MSRLFLLSVLLVATDAGATKIFINASDQTANRVSCGGHEAQYADDEGQKVTARLKVYGFDARYSQDFTNSPSLANNWGAQSFLSIHSNAGGGHGTETLYKSTAGKNLAQHVNDKLVAALKLPNRGLKYRDNLHMLNSTKMEAALTEVLFHDCTTNHATPLGTMSESCFLTKPDARVLTSEAMAQGLCSRWGVKCVEGPIPDPPHPVVDLAATMDEIPGQPSDFPPADGVFDLNVGQETTLHVHVTNTAKGTAPASHAKAGIVVAPELEVVEWHIYDNWPKHTCGMTWCLNSADGNAANPPHNNPGAAFSLELDGISPTETKRVDLKVRAKSPSGAAKPDIKFWVSHIDNFYEKTDFAAKPNNVGNYQTWNGGDLKFAWSVDVRSTSVPEDLAGPPADLTEVGDGAVGSEDMAQGEEDMTEPEEEDMTEPEPGSDISLRRPDAAAPAPVENGCSCSLSGQVPAASAAWLPVLLLGALALRSRRRRG